MIFSLIHPSRQRPTQAFLTRTNWESKAVKGFEYILSIDESDPDKEMYSQNFPTNPNYQILVSDNKSAIEAINNAAKIAKGDVLIVVSDDTDCPQNWDNMLRLELEGKKDFLLKTNDGIQPTLITMPVLDRKYYNRFGYIYFGGYDHMYADTEMTVVGHFLGRVIKSNLLFPHMHYSTGLTQKDELNIKNDATYGMGQKLFNERLRSNFGIENPVIKYEDIDWQPKKSIKLSILIATTESRRLIIQPLLQSLNRQKTDEVEMLVNPDERDCIGKKRDDLLKAATGDYVVFIDSDDKIIESYVERILKAIETKPDCVGITGYITTDGINAKRWYISREYLGWYESPDGVYYRTPNHISPIKRELALRAGFPRDLSTGEDAVFSQKVLPFLKTEVKIDEPLYHYDYRSIK